MVIKFLGQIPKTPDKCADNSHKFIVEPASHPDTMELLFKTPIWDVGSGQLVLAMPAYTIL